MKKTVFFFLLIIHTVVWGQQVDLHWNSVLPNGMDISITTDSTFYTQRNIPALESLSNIVSTAYMGDTLFATDGQYLYVIVNDTVKEQHTLNTRRAGRDQAFLVTIYDYGQRVMMAITAVDDTLKAFVWPNISSPEIIDIAIEPVVNVRSLTTGNESNIEISYLKDGLLFVYSRALLGGSLTQPEYQSYIVGYQSPVGMLRYNRRLVIIEDKDSTLVYTLSVDSLYRPVYFLDTSYSWKAQDIILGAYSTTAVIYGTDTAILVMDYQEGRRGEFYRRSFPLPSSYRFRQFIPNATGQVLLYPDQPDSLYVLYNYADEVVYYLMRTPGTYLSNIYPYSINLVSGYYPMYFFLTQPQGMLGCQRVSATAAALIGYQYTISSPIYLDLPEPGKTRLVSQSVSIKKIQTNPVLLHWPDTATVVSSYLLGFKPGVFWSKINDSTWQLEATVNVDNYYFATEGSLTWLYNGQVIDTTLTITADQKGTYTLRISNDVCTVDTTVQLIDPMYYLFNLKQMRPSLSINDVSADLDIYSIGYAVGDSLRITIVEDAAYDPGPEGASLYRDFQRHYLFDGSIVSQDSTEFIINVPYSGNHLFDYTYVPSDLAAGYPTLNFLEKMALISPHLGAILPERRYAIGDTARFRISTDTTNTDIYIKDDYTTRSFVMFEQVAQDEWVANVNNPYAQDWQMFNTDSIELILYVSTNCMDRLVFDLIAPDGSDARFYNGFSVSNNDYYIVGTPFCRQYAELYGTTQLTDVEDSTFLVGVYPLHFSPQANNVIDENSFVRTTYADCALEPFQTMVYNYQDNSVHADFSNFRGTTVNGTWRLRVYKPASDSCYAYVYPILKLPPQASVYHFFRDSGAAVMYVDIRPETYSNIMEQINDTSFVIHDQGDDSIKFYFGFRMFDYTPLSDELFHQTVGFLIHARKQPVYYDDKTYSFSPNGDGVNDYWNPLTTIAQNYPVLIDAPLSDLKVVVVNQKGMAIRSFLMSDFPQGWDGLDRNGNPVASGIYWYFILYRDQKYYGTILLMR